MALSDVQQWQTVGVDANTLAIIPCQESAAGTVWDNFEGDAQWDVTPASGNEPQIESASLPNANFTYAKIFDNNDYAQTANPAEFPTGDMTVEFMLFIDDVASLDTECIIGIYPASAGQRNFYIQRGGGGASDQLSFGISDDGTTFDNLTTPSGLSRGVWHYIACVYDASTSLTIYVDGSQVAQNTTSIDASIFNSNQPITYGSYNSSWLANNAFDGRVTDIRISNKARTSTEIGDHWAGTDAGTTYNQSITATATATPSITDLFTFVRTLSATLTATPTVAKLSSFFRTLSATVTGTATLLKGSLSIKELSSTVTGAVDIAMVTIQGVLMSVTATGTSAIDKLSSYVRTITRDVTGTASITTAKTLLRALTASVSASVVITKTFVVTVAMSATATVTASIDSEKAFGQILTATATAIVRLYESYWVEKYERQDDDYHIKY